MKNIHKFYQASELPLYSEQDNKMPCIDQLKEEAMKIAEKYVRIPNGGGIL